MNISQSLSLLKSSPSAETIDKVTTELLERENDLKTRLLYTTTYLQYIVPVYASLRPQLKLKVRRLFCSCLGLSNLLQQYKLTKDDVYLAFIKDLLLNPSLLVTLIESSSKIELMQVKSLFFGSKIFQTFEGKLVLDKYLTILATQLVEACKSGLGSPDYFLSFLTIHPIEAKFTLFDTFLTERNFTHLITAAKSMSTIQKRQLIATYLLPYLARFCSVGNLSTIASIINALGISGIEEPVLIKCSEINHSEVSQTVAFVVPDKAKQMNTLLELWGNEAYIKDTPYAHQAQLTTLMLILLNYFTKENKKDVSKQKSFLASITARLSSNDIALRNLGMTVAKKVTDGEIDFDIQGEMVVERPRIEIEQSINFESLKLAGTVKELTIDVQKVTAQLRDSDQDSDDDEAYDDQADAPPVFLKDLITKFNDDKVVSITKLLTYTIRLVRQKASFKMEVEFYSEELTSVLVGLLNKFDEMQFEELKLNAIVSVIVVNPAIASYVMTLLFTGDYSIQQRMIVLSAIGLSARELRGLDDKYVEKPQFDFPTNEIPQRKKNLIEDVVAPNSMEIKDEEEYGHEKFMSKGTVTRISSKLTTPKAITKPNNFAKVASKFFYPLANAWLEGIDMGSYNEMFLKHYLSTLEIIVQAAYPCYGFEEMAEMLMQIKENSYNVTI